MADFPVRYIYPYEPPKMLPGKGLVRVPGTGIGPAKTTLPGPPFGNIQPPNFIEGEAVRVDTRPTVYTEGSAANPRAGSSTTAGSTASGTNIEPVRPNMPGPRFGNIQSPNFIEGEFSRIDTRPTVYKGSATAGPTPAAGATPPVDGVPSNSAPIRGGYDVPRIAGPESLASKAARYVNKAAGLARGLAGNAVPVLAGSIASQIQQAEDPVNAMSPDERMRLAESNPAFYAANKDLVDKDIAQHNAGSSFTDTATGWLNKAGEALTGGSAFGFKADPRANALPDESIPTYMGRRIRESFTGAAQPIVDAAKSGAELVKQFGTGLTGESTQTAQPPAPPSQFPARPDTTMLSPAAGISVQTTPIGRTGALERRDYTTPNGTASGILPAGSGRGGFVGAATDAEASRNLQARAEQDAAARAIAESTDRSVNALRDTRAEQMGITRNALDTAEGRTKGITVLPSAPSPFSMAGDSRGDEVFRQNRLESTINDPRASRSERAAATSMYNSYLARPTASSPQSPTTNPADLQRYLLDQQKFGWQQQVDKGNLGLKQIELGTKAAAQTALSNKETAKERSAFLQKFIYPDENAPQAELGALTWQLSQDTNGAVPPEIMSNYIKKAAEESGVDWKKAPPKSLVQLGKRAMELAKADLQ